MCLLFSVVQILPRCAIPPFYTISIHLSWLSKLNWLIEIKKVPDTKSYLSTLIQKSCVFKLFHSRERIQKVPFLRIFLCRYVHCSVDGRPNRNNKFIWHSVDEAIDSTFCLKWNFIQRRGNNKLSFHFKSDFLSEVRV